MWVDVISVVARALSFVAQLQLAGIAIFVAMFGKQLQQSRDTISALGRYSAIIALLLVVLHYLLEAARMAGDFSGVFDPSLQRISLHSTIVVAATLRLLAIVTLAAGIRFAGAGRLLAPIVGTAILGLAFITVGHTSVHPLRYLLAPLLWLHLVIAAFWFGALLPLRIIVTQETSLLADRIVQAFSTIAVWLVPLIGLAGVLMAWALLPSSAALLAPYGKLLLFKSASFIALLSLATLNKLRLAPAIAHGQANAVNAFRHSLVLEYAVILIVLCATATMTSLFSP